MIKLRESAGLNGMIWHDAGRSGGHELTAGGQKKNHCGGGRDWSEIQRERDKESMPAQGSTSHNFIHSLFVNYSAVLDHIVLV